MPAWEQYNAARMAEARRRLQDAVREMERQVTDKQVRDDIERRRAIHQTRSEKREE